MEVLVRMHARPLRCRPTSRIDTRGRPRSILLFPFHKQGNCVLRLIDTTKLDRRSRGRTGRHLDGDIVRYHTLTDIHMVTVQVVRDIRVLAGPRLERL